MEINEGECDQPIVDFGGEGNIKVLTEKYYIFCFYQELLTKHCGRLNGMFTICCPIT